MAQYPDMCKEMSIELNSAFDESGYSECARQFQYVIDPVCQELSNVNQKMVGSSAEGTYFNDSDVDLLLIDQTGLQIGFNPQEAGSDSDKPYLRLTRGPLTPAGYTNLQIYLKGKKCCDNERKTLKCFFMFKIVRYNSHSIFLTNCKRKKRYVYHEVDMTVHGPAQMIQFNKYITIDHVVAYESKCIPIEMNSWFERTRLYNWPSKTTCELFKSMGCCYVAVGHSKSPEQHFEWRISPTRQELYLMLNLNPTQFRCYILLKFIKKLIHKHCSDSINSYHCKTALFWTIENTENNIWQPKKLIECLLKCLKLLFFWVKENKCPNYFIPEENMFETKVLNRVQLQMLHNVITNFPPLCSLLLLPVKIRSFKQMDAIITSTIDLKIVFTNFLYNASSIQEHTYTLQQYIELLKTKPRKACIQEFQDRVSPHKIDLNILLEMLDIKLCCIIRNLHMKSLLESNTFTVKDIVVHLKGMSSKSPIDHEYYYKLASIAAAQGAYRTCDVLLNNLHMMTRLDIYCQCNDSFQRGETQLNRLCYLNDSVLNNISENIRLTGQFINQLSISDIIQRFLFCLQFRDSEYQGGIVLPPLHFEANKTVGIPFEMISKTLIDFKNHRSVDIVSIHPTAYLYFLQYRNSGMMSKKGDMCEALEKLEHMNLISLQKGTYPHPDTTLNLLGHIYLTKGWYILAVQCFRRSWQIEPHYNAVKWHVMFMLFCNLSIHEKNNSMWHSTRKRIHTMDDEFRPFLKLKKWFK